MLQDTKYLSINLRIKTCIVILW